MISLQCNRCGYSQSGGYVGAREYALPGDKSLPILSLLGWCHDCGQLESIENTDPIQWLKEISTIQEQIASVNGQKKWWGIRWLYVRYIFGDMIKDRVINETFSHWAKKLEQALLGFKVLSDRKSPARCLTCGSTRVVPAEYVTDPNALTEPKIIHPDCGGAISSIYEGDICISRGSRRVRRYSIDGDYID